MGLKADEIILKQYLARLASMIYAMQKLWIPNKNLEKVIPHLRKACGYIKEEIQEIETNLKRKTERPNSVE